MIITGMKHFESVCQKKLVEWYQKNRPETPVDLSDVFIVWSCKTLQNYKCLAATNIAGDGIYLELKKDYSSSTSFDLMIPSATLSMITKSLSDRLLYIDYRKIKSLVVKCPAGDDES